MTEKVNERQDEMVECTVALRVWFADGDDDGEVGCGRWRDVP